MHGVEFARGGACGVVDVIITRVVSVIRGGRVVGTSVGGATSVVAWVIQRHVDRALVGGARAGLVLGGSHALGGADTRVQLVRVAGSADRVLGGGAVAHIVLRTGIRVLGSSWRICR